MFRKPKRKVKESLRRKPQDKEESPSQNHLHDEDDADDTNELLSDARKRIRTTTATTTVSSTATKPPKDDVMHSFDTAKDSISHSDLVTSTAQHHPQQSSQESKVGKSDDGIFRNQQRNKFLAGPIKAAQHVRVTARFDYQPDICKDYKETGFCGFGDTCIYLHDRGDTLSGWQLEQQWQEQQDAKKKQEQADIDKFVRGSKDNDQQSIDSDDDGLPFACFLCREHFKDPVVTSCQHYYCQNCILKHVRETSEKCPICHKDMHGVFNQPNKLISKKRKVLRGHDDDSWLAFFQTQSGSADDKP